MPDVEFSDYNESPIGVPGADQNCIEFEERGTATCDVP